MNKKFKLTFISKTSHQLRTPISSIKWLAELLLNGKAGKLTKEQKIIVKQIADSNEELVRIINELFDQFNK